MGGCQGDRRPHVLGASFLVKGPHCSGVKPSSLCPSARERGLHTAYTHTHTCVHSLSRALRRTTHTHLYETCSSSVVDFNTRKVSLNFKVKNDWNSGRRVSTRFTETIDLEAATKFASRHRFLLPQVFPPFLWDYCKIKATRDKKRERFKHEANKC